MPGLFPVNVDYSSFVLRLKTSGAIIPFVSSRLWTAHDDSNLRTCPGYYIAVLDLSTWKNLK